MSLSRRNFLEASAVTGAFARKVSADVHSKNSDRPNILYVILEDIGPQLSCYGEPQVRTPNLDRFAGQGIRFAHAYSAAPVCSPSRSALMTGCYQTRIGAHQHRTWPWRKPALKPPVRHISDWFRDAGYFTCNLKPAKAARGLHGAAGSGKVDLNFLSSGTGEEAFFDGFDWNQRKDNQPFFAHITIIETHKGEGWKVARRQPKAELVDPNKLELAPYYPDTEVVRDECANYLDAIHLSDGYVGELLARLEREGLAGNTIVVISSDHGPLFRGKQFLYDGGIHVPLLIRFPDGRRAGTVNEDLISSIDIAPTLLGFAGIRPPSGAMQGHDVFEDNYQPRTHIFAARDRMDISIDRMRAVRSKQYKYIRNYFPATPYMQHNPYKEQEYPTWNLVKQLYKDGKLNAAQSLFPAPEKPIEELFSLKNDPHEVHNLAADPAYRETLKQMRALVDGFVEENDGLVRPEDPIDIYRGYYGHLPEDPAV